MLMQYAAPKTPTSGYTKFIIDSSPRRETAIARTINTPFNMRFTGYLLANDTSAKCAQTSVVTIPSAVINANNE